MSNKLRMAILVAVFSGLIAAYGIYNFLREQWEATAAFKRATTHVVVAAKDVQAGTLLTKDTVKLSPQLKESLPPGYFSAPEQAVGKVLKVGAVAGEPILESKLSGDGAGLTAFLTSGHRAIAVKVDEIIGVSGFIAPNDRVDVIALVEPPGKDADQHHKISKIVLQNKRVLSVEQDVEAKPGQAKVARSITLELTPEETEKLSLAALEGKIILALRARGDEETVQTRGSTTRALIATVVDHKNGKNGKYRKVAAPPQYQVEVYLGSAKSVQQFSHQ